LGAFLLAQKPRFPLQFALSALISAAIACAAAVCYLRLLQSHPVKPGEPEVLQQQPLKNAVLSDTECPRP
jgi:hypothetical protein